MTAAVSTVPAVLAGETERAYLVRLGLAQPTRGRFSGKAHDALALARVTFGDDVFAEPVKATAPATPATPRTPREPATPKVKVDTSQVDPKEVRDWARENGHVVSPKGRLPHAVVAAFLKVDGARTGAKARPIASLPVQPKVRDETQGFILEPSRFGFADTLLAFENCASTGGCGKPVSRCTCSTGPKAPHYLPGALSNAVLTLDKPVA